MRNEYRPGKKARFLFAPFAIGTIPQPPTGNLYDNFVVFASSTLIPHCRPPKNMVAGQRGRRVARQGGGPILFPKGSLMQVQHGVDIKTKRLAGVFSMQRVAPVRGSDWGRHKDKADTPRWRKA